MKLNLILITILTCLVTPTNLFSQVVNITPTNLITCNGQIVKVVVGPPYSGSSFLWQDSSSGGWSNLLTGNVFQGVFDDTLIINTNNANFSSKKLRCIVDSSSASINYDTSDVFSLSILPALTKPVISTNQSICFNTQADTLRTIQLATGANGQFTYQWQASFNGIS
ncbi:MAG: hypothetical protein KBG11_11970, partial [Bacteroidia bacterium]|nr:hypothetical protein [Bacteroidia bacterium]